MRHSVKEEEIGSFDCHDEHDPTCNRYQKERDDVQDSDDVQRDVAAASEFCSSV